MTVDTSGMALPQQDRPLDRAIGALVGAAIGDALGWPQERRNARSTSAARPSVSFRTWKLRAGGRYYPHEEIIRAGEYSDDTQLLISTARSILSIHSWSKHFCRIELPLWLLYERGGGGATKRAATLWEGGVAPWRSEQPEDVSRYFEAGGNGAAMRIAPHVLMHGTSLDTCRKQVMINGISTHGHPRALVGALLYAQALWYVASNQQTIGYGSLVDHLLDTVNEWEPIPQWDKGYEEWLFVANRYAKPSYAEMWKSVVQECVIGLEKARWALRSGALANDTAFLDEIGSLSKETNGAGTVTALAAIYFASQYAADPVTGLLSAAFAHGSDTDTLASMTGGLLGLMHGTEWIRPEWEKVQDIDYLRDLAQELHSGLHRSDDGATESWADRDTRKVVAQLVSGTTLVPLGPLGKATLMERLPHQSQKAGWQVASWKLSTQVGQTIFIKKFSRATEVDRPQPELMVTSSRPVPRDGLLKLLEQFLEIFPAGMSFESCLKLLIRAVRLVKSEKPAAKDPVIDTVHSQELLSHLVRTLRASGEVPVDDERASKLLRTLLETQLTWPD